MLSRAGHLCNFNHPGKSHWNHCLQLSSRTDTVKRYREIINGTINTASKALKEDGKSYLLSECEFWLSSGYLDGGQVLVEGWSRWEIEGVSQPPVILSLFLAHWSGYSKR